MRRIAHISDLRFGREAPDVVQVLLAELAAARPDLIVVSGDLTEHARRSQFERARAFLLRLPAPVIVVPGNHDVPRHEVLGRLAPPLRRYRRYISDELMPAYVDGEVAVFGVSTARSLSFRTGRISVEQIRALRARLAAVPDELCKIVVTHHQLIPVPGHATGELVGRARLALTALDLYGVDLVLAGELHRPFADEVRTYPLFTRAVIAASCGSSTAIGVPGEPSSYNLVDVEPGMARIAARSWTGARFQEVLRSVFLRGHGGWRRVELDVQDVALQPLT